MSSAVDGRWFYVGVAITFSLVAVAGFTPSYIVKISNGTFDLPAIFHVHAVLFVSWTLLNVARQGLWSP